ncbi:MAG: hypothetical protein HWE24_18445 [Oceanospirillaceae bacterium]|nr:hypothetical protein [Oceanospirillaceae bacterium]
MKNTIYKFITYFILPLSIIGCSNMPMQISLRTIFLNGDEVKEEKVGDFTTWKCRDFSYGGKILLEVGFRPGAFSFVSGFILFDGTNQGSVTTYERKGLNHEWNWGKGLPYKFLIKPDGTGLYYDFSNVEEGESIKANDIYKCQKT